MTTLSPSFNHTRQVTNVPVEVKPEEFKADAANIANLLGITLDALKISPPFYISSVLGWPWTWLPPYRRYSEFTIVDLWQWQRMLQFLYNVTVPSLPFTPPTFGPPLLNALFWQPSVILQRPDHNGSYTTFLDEAWFFVNGIMTNAAIAQINTAYLAYLFHRPLTLIQNSTDSFFVDLCECALGKEGSRHTESAIKAFPPIYDALKSPAKKRVVVIAHSQGTIIMSIVLRMLNAITTPTTAVPRALAPRAERYAPPEFVYPDQEPINLDDFAPLTEEELAKLEIYCFANCANVMPYFRGPENGDTPIPWIESFGNEYDLVARLGMLAPAPSKWGIQIDGPLYKRPRAWGHLLTEHYLFALADQQHVGRKQGGHGDGAAPYTLLNAAAYPGATTPRLYSYINGGSPRL